MSLHFMTPERLALPEQDELYTEFVSFLTSRYPDEDLDSVQIQSLFDRQLAETYKNVGNHFMTLKPKKEPRKSIQLYECAISLHDTPAYHTNLAAAYAEVGEHNKCIAACKRALEIDPTFAKAYTRMARQLSKNGQYRESAEAFQKALEIDPNDTSSRNALKKIQAVLQE